MPKRRTAFGRGSEEARRYASYDGRRGGCRTLGEEHVRCVDRGGLHRAALPVGAWTIARMRVGGVVPGRGMRRLHRRRDVRRGVPVGCRVAVGCRMLLRLVHRRRVRRGRRGEEVRPRTHLLERRRQRAGEEDGAEERRDPALGAEGLLHDIEITPASARCFSWPASAVDVHERSAVWCRSVGVEASMEAGAHPRPTALRGGEIRSDGGRRRRGHGGGEGLPIPGMPICIPGTLVYWVKPYHSFPAEN